MTPNAELAVRRRHRARAPSGAIAVDRRQRDRAEGVWAAGDCAESFHRVSRRPVHIALGTVANRQGRVAGINLGGGYATFPGVVGTAVTEVLRDRGRPHRPQRARGGRGRLRGGEHRVESTSRAGYFPGAEPITVKLLAERGTGRVLGGQIVGGEGAAKRIDVVAAVRHRRHGRRAARRPRPVLRAAVLLGVGSGGRSRPEPAQGGLTPPRSARRSGRRAASGRRRWGSLGLRPTGTCRPGPREGRRQHAEVGDRGHQAVQARRRQGGAARRRRPRHDGDRGPGVRAAREATPRSTGGRSTTVDFQPKVRIEVLAEDQDAVRIADVVTEAARTDKIGDGKVWVTEVEQLVRIRTGEKGDDAI